MTRRLAEQLRYPVFLLLGALVGAAIVILYLELNPPAGTIDQRRIEQIAQERRSGRKWGEVFQEMKSQGLIQAETLGQVLGRYDRARHSRS